MVDKTLTTGFVRKVIMGLGYLEGYGDHPGIGTVVLLIALGFIAAGWIGGIVSIIVYVPILCIGAYSRANDYERGHNAKN